MPSEISHRPTRLLIYTFPAIFIVGFSVILLTVFSFYITHPSYFEYYLPSISRAAAFPPGSYILGFGMSLSGLMILGYWQMTYAMYRARMKLGSDSQAAPRLGFIAYVLGLLAGLMTIFLSIINSEMDGPLHEKLSIGMFAFQFAAILFDRLFYWHLRRHMGGRQHWPKNPDAGYKALHFYAILFASLALLAFYLLRISGAGTNERLIYACFVTFEYAVVTLTLAFPLFCYRDIKAHYAALYSEN